MSRDQFSIFGFDHVVEVFGRSCLTNIVLFSGPWTNTSKLATRMGSFFWPSTSGKHESRLKLTKARQEMPNAASNVNTSQAIGKVTKWVVGTDWENSHGVTEAKTKKSVLLTYLSVETYQLAKWPQRN